MGKEKQRPFRVILDHMELFFNHLYKLSYYVLGVANSIAGYIQISFFCTTPKIINAIVKRKVIHPPEKN
jgi:hypothetical protein